VTNPVVVHLGNYATFRGGGYGSKSTECRSAARRAFLKDGGLDVGFRVVLAPTNAAVLQ
jgi:hypothetical protein